MERQHAKAVSACLSRTIMVSGAVVVLTAWLSAGGCYERVVGAHGFGADQYNVSEPYQESGKLDEWIFGKQPRSNKTLLPTN